MYKSTMRGYQRGCFPTQSASKESAHASYLKRLERRKAKEAANTKQDVTPVKVAKTPKKCVTIKAECTAPIGSECCGHVHVIKKTK